MIRLSRFVLRHKLAVALAWLALILAGGASAGRLSEPPDPRLSVPWHRRRRGKSGDRRRTTATAATATR